MITGLPATDHYDLSKLWTGRPQNRDPATTTIRPINALDTETSGGDIFLLCDSDGRYLDKITLDTVLDFLSHKKYENAWNFFYGLHYDGAVILKLFGDRLFDYLHTRKLRFEHGDYVVTYFPRKCLKISRGHHSASFYDIAQFYGGSLADAYQDNIGPLDAEYLEFKKKRAEFSLTFYRRNTTAVRDYCIKDCMLAKALAEKWAKLFGSAFGFYPKRWVSSGYLAEKVMIFNDVAFPRFSDAPYHAQEFAFASYFGARIELAKRGWIGDAYAYDIRSAYPHKIAALPDLRNGHWVQQKAIHPDAALGFFKIAASVPDTEYLSPFAFRANHTLVFPTGNYATYATLDELKACGNPNYYAIQDSWQYIPRRPDYLPYKTFVEGLYEKRLALKEKNDPLQLPIKIILNSMYGKAGEKIRSVIGNIFHPIIFATITGATRAQMYSFIKSRKLERDLIGIATDSVFVRKQLDILESQTLGTFSFVDYAEDAFFLQNGFYRMNGRWKQRGLGRLGSREIEALMPFEKDGRLYYRFVVKRSAGLLSSIIQNHLSEIGKIRMETREVNLNADRKRFWLGTLESIDRQEMNESMPLSLNYIQKEEI